MSALHVTTGTAAVSLDATYDRQRAGAGSVEPFYVTDDLLSATAAVLRAARDPRADTVQDLVRQ